MLRKGHLGEGAAGGQGAERKGRNGREALGGGAQQPLTGYRNLLDTACSEVLGLLQGPPPTSELVPPPLSSQSSIGCSKYQSATVPPHTHPPHGVWFYTPGSRPAEEKAAPLLPGPSHSAC